MKQDPEIVSSIKTPQQWRSWLTKNHAKYPDGIRLRFFKKATGKQTLSYAQALDEALCFGWIDTRSNSESDDTWVQIFTPRRPKSMWSKTNRDHVARLIKAKKMRAPGLKAVESAKKDGRWDNAYDSSANMQIPADFMRALKKDKVGFAFFKTLNKTNLYAIGYRLQTAKKSETRTKRMQLILRMLAEGKKFH